MPWPHRTSPVSGDAGSPARRIDLVLLKGESEWCQQRDTVQVHQIGKLADLGKLGQAQPGWAKLMPACGARPSSSQRGGVAAITFPASDVRYRLIDISKLA